METGNKTFISYSSEDEEVVEGIVEKLETEGLTCWYAKRDMPPGGHYDEFITSAIESSQAFVVIASKDSEKSEYVKNEIKIAVDSSITIYPVRIQNFKAKGLSFFIGRNHWVDAWTPPIEEHLKRLASQIKAAENITEPLKPVNTDCQDNPNVNPPPPNPNPPWRRWILPLGLALTAILVLGGLFLLKRDRTLQYAKVEVADRSIDYRMEDSGVLVLLPADERNGYLALTLPSGRYVLEILTDANGKGGIRLENVKSGTKVAMEGAEPHSESDEFSILCSGRYPLSPDLDDQLRVVFFKLHSSPVRLGWIKQQK